jgi:hypothetical protein
MISGPQEVLHKSGVKSSAVRYNTVMEKIGLFDITTNFCVDKSDLRKHPLFKKSYDKFMINRVLSMSPKTCHLAMFMSSFDDIPQEQHFAFLNNEIDKEYIYFNYVKRSDDVPKKTLDYIMEYFQCSLERCLEYVRLMSEKQIDTILEMYKIRDTKIKTRKTKK